MLGAEAACLQRGFGNILPPIAASLEARVGGGEPFPGRLLPKSGRELQGRECSGNCRESSSAHSRSMWGDGFGSSLAPIPAG